MTSAFAYLLFHTTRNRIQSMVRRLRSPRYAIGAGLGVLYFYSVFFRNMSVLRKGNNPFLGDTAETLAPLLVVLVVSGIWLFGGDRSALAFTEAEVSMLLTAPVSRRDLIVYKLVRTQILIVLNAMIWVFLLRRGSSMIPAPLTALAIWSVFTTFSLHRIGAALLRAKHAENHSAGKPRNWTFAVVAIIAFAVVLGRHFSTDTRLANAPDPFAFLKTFIAMLHEPFARTVLLPFRLVVEPVFAHNMSEWALAFLPAIGIILVHVVWVLRTDAAFEEAAAAASAEQAKRIAAMRARRSMGVQPTAKSASGTIALAATGRPAVAIVWKNMIALRRTFQSGALIRMGALMVLATAGIGWKTGDIPMTVGVMALCMALVVTLVGIQGFRNDLRSDMQQLPFLKSLPLAGADLVFAEILSGTLTLAALQFALLVISYTALAFSATHAVVPLAARTAMLVVSPIVLLAVDGVFFTIANGAAVLFPAWLRLGPGGPGGVEMIGQSMLSMIIAGLTFLLLMLLPAAIGGAGFLLLRPNMVAALAAAGVAGGVVLATECYFLILLLGSSFERAEPQQVT